MSLPTLRKNSNFGSYRRGINQAFLRSQVMSRDRRQATTTPLQANPSVSSRINCTSNISFSATHTRNSEEQGLPALEFLRFPSRILPEQRWLLGDAAHTRNGGGREAACVDGLMTCINAGSWNKKGSREKLKVRCLISSVWRDDPMHGLPFCFSPAKNLIPLDHAIFDGVADVLLTFRHSAASQQKTWG